MNNSARAGIAGRLRKYDNEVPEEKAQNPKQSVIVTH